MSRPEGCEVRLARADGRKLRDSRLLLVPSKSAGLESHFPIYSSKTPPASSIAQANPALSLSTPAKSVFLPDSVMFVFHRGCHDLENSRRDASLALILTATN